MGQNAFGQPLRRHEDLRLLTGAGCFTADLAAPGQVHAVMLRSPHAHARLRGIDAEAARAMPGILAVLTGAEYAEDGVGNLPAGSKLIQLPGTDPALGFAARPPRPALASGRVRFVGDTVAMVIGETLDAARDAAEQIIVDYDPLPAVTDTAAAPSGPLVWDEAPENICFRWNAGDGAAVDAAFAGAATVVRATFVNNRIHVGSVETRGALGQWDAAAERYTLHTGSQMPHLLRDDIAATLGIAPGALRVRIADVGGSFGIKNAVYPEQVLVLWAARRLGRAVLWLGERGDGFQSDYQARDNVSTGELALDAEGRFLALRVATLAAVGAYLAPKGELAATSNTPALAGVYRLPRIAVSVTGVFTNTAPTEVYRGAGRPEAIHLLERLVDEAARATGIDRVELRRRNHLTPSELPYRTALGLDYDSGDFPRLLEDALARADLAGFPARREGSARRGRLRGFGFAQYCERVAGAWAEEVWLEIDPAGKLTVLIGTMSNGQGHETAYAQLVAAQLGIDAADVTVLQGDTDRIPSGRGTGGSASLGIGGAALAHAATDLIAKLAPLAADALEAAAVDIGYEEGKFRILGTDRAIALAAVAARLDGVLTGSGAFRPAGPTFPNGCHLAEVEIDPETGETTLLAYTMLHDFGRVLNPLLLEGQLQGGVAQGIGQALHERVVHDAESGQLLTGSLMDYRLPRAADLPPLTLATMATPSPLNPLGVKGCGEAGAAGAPPAVMNAIMDALAPLGVARVQMPATSERVWQAIQAVTRLQH